MKLLPCFCCSEHHRGRAARHQRFYPAIKTVANPTCCRPRARHGVTDISHPGQARQALQTSTDQMGGSEWVGGKQGLWPQATRLPPTRRQGEGHPSRPAIWQRRCEQILATKRKMPRSIPAPGAHHRDVGGNFRQLVFATVSIGTRPRRKHHGRPAMGTQVLCETQRTLQATTALLWRKVECHHQHAARRGTALHQPSPARR